MTEKFTRYESWSTCDACGFQGLLEFTHREDEVYDDPDSLGVMLDATCPSCDSESAVLVVLEEYHAMLRMARSADRE